MDRTADIVIVGAGIVGLAHAYFALKKGYRVVLFEREQFATGASVRNFGLLWPIGQEPGDNLNRALRSRKHWEDVAKEAGFWLNDNGSLHLAYHNDEWDVLNEFESMYAEAYRSELVTPEQIKRISPNTKQANLKGGLLSLNEGTVYAREAIRRIPLWLEEKFGLILRFGHVVTEVDFPTVKTPRERWKVGQVFICSGADFETLFPEHFENQKITKCKLQMLKASATTPGRLGPTLCAGLTLTHYKAFRNCKSLSPLVRRLENEASDFRKFGIHVLLAQTESGEFIIGDSHQYALTHEPFNDEVIDNLVLQYLHTFLEAGELKINQRWNGIYAKHEVNTFMAIDVAKNVKVINGLGGGGMTLSFGIAEEQLSNL